MAFDPALPVTNSPILSAELRNQFNGLKDLIDDNIPAAEKGAPDGVASLDGAGRLVEPADWDTLVNKPMPVADGTYTMGFGTAQNGTITVVDGIITGIQEASNGTPGGFTASGFGDAGYNGFYVDQGDGTYKLDDDHWIVSNMFAGW